MIGKIDELLDGVDSHDAEEIRAFQEYLRMRKLLREARDEIVRLKAELEGTKEDPRITELEAERDGLVKGCDAWMKDCSIYQKRCDELGRENKRLEARLQDVKYRLGGVRFDLGNTTKCWNESLEKIDRLRAEISNKEQLESPELSTAAPVEPSEGSVGSVEEAEWLELSAERYWFDIAGRDVDHLIRHASSFGAHAMGRMVKSAFVEGYKLAKQRKPEPMPSVAIFMAELRAHIDRFGALSSGGQYTINLPIKLNSCRDALAEWEDRAR